MPHLWLGGRLGGRPAVLAVAVSVLLGASLAAEVPLSMGDAQRLYAKLTRIRNNGWAARPASLRTRITEAEINSYLRFGVPERLPSGLTEVYVALEDGGRLSGKALLDLDRLKVDRASDGAFDPLAYLSGTVPVVVTGRLQAGDGMVRLELLSVSVSGVPVPTSVVESLVRRYSRSSEVPEGVSLDEPFQLPAAIREIAVAKGEAVVIQ